MSNNYTYRAAYEAEYGPCRYIEEPWDTHEAMEAFQGWPDVILFEALTTDRVHYKILESLAVNNRYRFQVGSGLIALIHRG
jgi:hypothetical protein